MNYFTRNVCKSERPSLERISEIFMIKSELVQNGCLQVVAISFSAHGGVTNLICFTMRVTFFNSSTCHPDGECFSMMVSTHKWIHFAISSFLHWCASELTGPHHQCFFQ